MQGVHGSPRPATEGQTPAPPIVHRTARCQAPVMSGASKPEFEIEKLRREHNVTQFDCGNRALNTWLHKYAWTNQQADSAKTYVAGAGGSCGRLLCAYDRLRSQAREPGAHRQGSGESPDSASRSEEHTSELQSLRHLVCRLLLEKKKTHSLSCAGSSRSGPWRSPLPRLAR